MNSTEPLESLKSFQTLLGRFIGHSGMFKKIWDIPKDLNRTFQKILQKNSTKHRGTFLKILEIPKDASNVRICRTCAKYFIEIRWCLTTSCKMFKNVFRNSLEIHRIFRMSMGLLFLHFSKFQSVLKNALWIFLLIPIEAILTNTKLKRIHT